MANSRELLIRINLEDNTAVQVKILNNNLDQTKRQAVGAAGGLNVLKGALGALGIAMSARAVVELTKSLVDNGQAWQTARSAVEATMGSLASANQAIEAAQAATEGLVSKTEAAIAVNVFLRNGLAQTGAEAGKLAQTGGILSQVYEAQGATFEKYIRFITTGNIALMDNFNLNKQMLDARSQLIQNTEGLSKAEADVQARIQLTNEAAQGYLDTMPEATRASIEMDAAVTDLAASIGVKLLPAVTAVRTTITGMAKSLVEEADLIQELNLSIASSSATYQEYTERLKEAYYQKGLVLRAAGMLTEAQYEEARAAGSAADSMAGLGAAYGPLIDNKKENIQATEEEIKAAEEAAEAQLRLQAEANKRYNALNEAARRYAESQESILNRHTDRIAAMDRKAGDMAINHAQSIGDLRQQIAEAANRGVEEAQSRLNRSLEELANSHNDRIRDIKAQLSNLNREFRYNETIAEVEYQDRLDDLAQRQLARLRDMQSQMLGLNQDYQTDSIVGAEEHQDQIDDMNSAHARRRAQLEDQIRRTSWMGGREQLIARLADEDREHQEALARLERDYAQEVERNQAKHDQQVAQLAARIAEEQRQQAEETERLERDRQQEIIRNKEKHDQQATQLRERISEENRQYGAQVAQMRARAAEDMARMQAENAQRVAALEARIAIEIASYQRQLAELQRQKSEEATATEQAESRNREEYGRTIVKINDTSTTVEGLKHQIEQGSRNSIASLGQVQTAYVRLRAEIERTAQAASRSMWGGGPIGAGGRRSFQMGTSFVPQTGLALLHRGEAVIPAGRNRGGNSQIVNVYLTYSPTVSLADKYEAEQKLVPYIQSALRKELSLRGVI